jgi:surfeit locus 1 family protein
MTKIVTNPLQHKQSSSKKRVVGVVLLLIMGLVFISLGRWQLSRADERRAIAQSIETGRAQPPIELNAATPKTDLIDWRSAKIQGTWAPQFTVLLDNRNLDGRPGYWVATPFIHSDGSAVLVLRGWLPRLIAPMSSGVTANQVMPASLGAMDAQLATQLLITTPTGPEQVVGEMTPHVPRLYELKADPKLQMAVASAFTEQPQASSNQLTRQIVEADIRQLPTVQNLQLDVLAQATGLKLLPIVLKQTSPAPDGLVRQWAGPSIDSDTNMGYAMQWFAFAAIAITAAGVLAWRGLKRAKI